MIRKATLKDLKSIIALVKLNQDTFSKYEIPAAESYIKELIAKQNKDGKFFVKTIQNKIVGCAGYSKEQDTKGVYSFNWLAVHPNFKRHGIATELYKNVEKWLKS